MFTNFRIKSTGICILLMIVAIMNINSANANILTTLTGTEAQATSNEVFQAQPFISECGDEYWYVQRLVINGKVEMVKTQFVYPVGKYELTFYGVCGGYNIYGLGTCACKQEVAKNAVSMMDFVTAASIPKEVSPLKILYSGVIQIMEFTTPGGLLWIRKGEKNLSI